MRPGGGVGRGEPVREREWLGESWALRVRRGAVEVLRAVFGDELRRRMRRLARSDLPILDEWRRLYPDLDPLELHDRCWQVTPVCPGGGELVWNEEWHSMESSLHGPPGRPKSGPSLPPAARSVQAAELGLTFERDGLRARHRPERELDRTRRTTRYPSTSSSNMRRSTRWVAARR